MDHRLGLDHQVGDGHGGDRWPQARAAHSARNSWRSSLRSSLTSQAVGLPVGSAPGPPSIMTWRRR